MEGFFLKNIKKFRKISTFYNIKIKGALNEIGPFDVKSLLIGGV